MNKPILYDGSDSFENGRSDGHKSMDDVDSYSIELLELKQTKFLGIYLKR